MAKSNMSAEMMVSVSARWVDPGRDRAALQSLPVTRVLLPVLDEAHRALAHWVQKAAQERAQEQAALARQRAALSERWRAADARCDRKRERVHRYLTASAETCVDPEVAAVYRSLRQRLLPEGKVSTPPSAVGVARAPLEPEIDNPARALLEQLAPRDGALAQCVYQWLEAAGERDRLRHRRNEMMRCRAPAREPCAQAQAARQAWLSVVGRIRAGLAQPQPPSWSQSGGGDHDGATVIAIRRSGFPSGFPAGLSSGLPGGLPGGARAGVPAGHEGQGPPGELGRGAHDALCERILGPLRRAQALAGRQVAHGASADIAEPAPMPSLQLARWPRAQRVVSALAPA